MASTGGGGGSGGGGGAATLAAAALTARDFSALATLCSEAELEGAAAAPSPAAPNAYAPLRAAHVLAYLLAGDVSNARFVLRRAPQAARESDADLRAAWELGVAMEGGDTVCAQRILASHGWSASMKPLAEAVAEALRERTLALIGQAYTTIALGKVRVHAVASFADVALECWPTLADSRRVLPRFLMQCVEALGLPEADCAERCTAAGWRVDGASGSVHVERRAAPSDHAVGIESLKSLSEYVVSLR